MDTIFIENFLLRGKHGVSDKERAQEQVFSLDITAIFDARKAGASDDLEDTVDYGHFRMVAKEVVENQSFHLLEKMAEVIAEKILEDVRLARVSVTIRKTEVYPDCTAGVTIERERSI